MPELPEVEVTRLGLLPDLPGRRITKIVCSNKRLRISVPRTLLAKHVLASTIVTIDRRAKYLLFRMASGSTMVVHLGMTGKLTLVPSAEPNACHDHLRLQLDNGMDLRFNDSRRFGSVAVWPPAQAEKMERDFGSKLGVEPLGRQFQAALLLTLGRSRKQPVKNFLMDSRTVAGIGNIYANEILFAAKIHPLTPVNRIADKEWRMIVRATRRILKKAIREGGSTISDFLGASGNPGYFQIHFNVYHRRGQPCKRCTGTIAKTVVGGRATFFCPACQYRETE